MTTLTLTVEEVTLTVAETVVTITNGGGGGDGANLAYTAAPTNGVVTSDTGTDATLTLADGTNAGLMAPAQHTKLAGIETGATADQSAAEILAALLTVDGAGSGLDADTLDGLSSAEVFVKASDDTDDITVGTTNKFATAAEKTKLGHISVTQAVDLDTIESRVNALDAAVVLKGSWDASAGTFPGSGTAQAGDSYIVSVGGTVDSVVFVANDRIVAILDNASTGTYANNWLKLDYTDQVLSVAGKTGAVTIQKADITDFDAYVPGGTDVPVTDGGTGASNAADARTNLGLVIGTNVQAYDADLTDLASKWAAASASAQASLQFHEDTDNGAHKITVTAPAAIASDKTITWPDETGTVLTTASGVAKTAVPCEFIIACSDETTALTTGTAKVTFRAPYAFTVTAVRASVTTAPTGASLLTVDINENTGGGATTILSTKLTIDASEKTSTTAATAAVISDSAIADDSEITIDIDQVGSTIAGAGLKVTIIGAHAV
jgi:hypothetical protein